MTRTAAICAIALAVAIAAPARAQNKTRRIKVRVVEVAGDQAYLEPGRDAGLRVGDTVTIRKSKHKVTAVTATHAAIEPGKVRVREGDRGVARVAAGDRADRELPAPIPLSELRDQWTPAVKPATTQTPTPVPLGKGVAAGAYQVIMIGSTAMVVPLRGDGRPVARGTLGARLRAEPWRERPFGFDADVAASMWLGRGLGRGLGADSRPIVKVSELRLRYGAAASPYLGLGRLRYAASTVGLLDGVRVRSPEVGGGFTVAAFGGFVPDTLSNALSTDVARFGVEASYADLSSSWRPVIDLVATGSMFDSRLDERRLTTTARVYPGPLSVAGYAEVSGFPRNNDWDARRVEMTAAGLDVSVRGEHLHAGARVDSRQPERSRWLASLLPSSWLCTASAQPPADPPAVEPCAGFRDYRHTGSVDAGYTGTRFAAVLGGTAVTGPHFADDVEEVSVYGDARVMQLARGARIQLGAMALHTDFVESAAVRLGGGAPLPIGMPIELDVYYRAALIRYRADIEDLLQHRVGADAAYPIAADLDLAATLEVDAGPDVTAVGLFATAIWRPL